MYIMTKNGWKPLISFAGVWKARHEKITTARARLEEAQKVVARDDQERRARNFTLNQRYRDLFEATDALLG